MSISPVNPPGTLSSQRLVTLSTSGPSGKDWVAGWGYPPHRYGSLMGIGARFKHRTNIYNGCNVSPYQDLLCTIYIKWITCGFQFPRATSSTHNIAIEMVPNPTFGRIRPDLNGGVKEWVQLNTPTGGTTAAYILTGSSVGGPPSSDIRDSGRIIKLPNNYILHPWAKVNGTGTFIDAPITNLISQNTGSTTADSRIDCVACDWWVRLVPFDEAQAIGDITTNPIILVTSGDGYVQRPRFGLNDDSQCNDGVGASSVVTLTTEWTQVGYFTCTGAADIHNSLSYAGISAQEFLSAPPPGYDGTIAPTPDPDPPVVRPSVGNWFPKITSTKNTWTTGGSVPTPPTSLAIDDTGDEMLLQQSAATAAKRTIIFRAVDATDGFTAETGLSFGAGDIKISKNGAAEANHAGTVTEIAGGQYKYEFSAGEVDTCGALSFRTNKSGVRPTAFVHQVVAFDPANLESMGLSYLDAAVTSRLAGTVYENTDAFLDKTDGVETDLTVREALRLVLAVLGGKLSGAGTGTEVFRNAVADTKARVTATVDTAGNRTAITTDLT